MVVPIANTRKSFNMNNWYESECISAWDTLKLKDFCDNLWLVSDQFQKTLSQKYLMLMLTKRIMRKF